MYDWWREWCTIGLKAVSFNVIGVCLMLVHVDL